MFEKTLEKAACKYIQSLQGLSFKWVSPGTPGAPDRMFVLPGPQIVFCEFKRPGRQGVLSMRQVKFRRKLAEIGCNILVADNLPKFKEDIQALLRRASETG